MSGRRRPRLTYANVVATLALFLALGGVGYAATQLPKNSVGPAQLRTGAVSSAEIRNNAIAAADLANGVVPECPSGTALAAGACIETTRQQPGPLLEAIVECAVEDRRLPSEGELAAFALQYVPVPSKATREWVGPYYIVNGEMRGNYMTASKAGTGFGAEASIAEYAYRCATGPST